MAKRASPVLRVPPGLSLAVLSVSPPRTTCKSCRVPRPCRPWAQDEPGVKTGRSARPLCFLDPYGVTAGKSPKPTQNKIEIADYARACPRQSVAMRSTGEAVCFNRNWGYFLERPSRLDLRSQPKLDASLLRDGCCSCWLPASLRVSTSSTSPSSSGSTAAVEAAEPQPDPAGARCLASSKVVDVSRKSFFFSLKGGGDDDDVAGG